MASLTTFRGRRCTKVRRGLASQINNSTVKASDAVPTTSSSVATAAVPTTTSKSVFAPTTNYPAISGNQIATVIIPNISPLPATTPLATPSPPIDVPPPAATPSAAPAPVIIPPSNPSGGKSPAPALPPASQVTAPPSQVRTMPQSTTEVSTESVSNESSFVVSSSKVVSSVTKVLSTATEKTSAVSTATPRPLPGLRLPGAIVPVPPRPLPLLPPEEEDDPPPPFDSSAGPSVPPASGAPAARPQSRTESLVAEPSLTSPKKQSTPAVVAPLPPSNPRPNNPSNSNTPTFPDVIPPPGNGGGIGGGINEPNSPDPAATPLIQSNGPGPDFPISLGRGPVSGDSFTPVPIVYTTAGIVKTTTMLPTGTVIPKGTVKGGESGKKPTIQPVPGSTAAAGNDSSGVGSKAKSTAIIAGVVSAVVALSLLCALLLFCLRRRKQQPRGDSMAVTGATTEVAPGSETPIGRHVRTLFAGRTSRGAEFGSPRSRTPAMERGMGGYVQDNDGNPRRRSSSEPASRAFKTVPDSQIPVETNRLPKLPTVVQEHRRSVSSVSGLAYPVLSDLNNPFIDPDPNAQLRIVNPDNSRNGTPASTPLTGKPPMLGAAGILGAAGAFVSQPSPLKNSSPVSPKAYHRRQRSMVQDPFADPEPITNPFADPIVEPAGAPGLSSYRHNKRDSVNSIDSESAYSIPTTSRHSRSRTLTAVPLITKTAPSSVGSSHHHQGSADSGFHSASPGASPGSVHSPRFGGALGLAAGLFGRGQNSQNREPARLLPTSAPRNGSYSQEASGRGSGSAQRISTTSSSSSLSFPSSWGSPGPTRPHSFARDSGSGAPPVPARVSDPFDLDVPELLAYASSEVGTYSAVTLSRSGSQISARTERERTPNEGPGPSGLNPNRR